MFLAAWWLFCGTLVFIMQCGFMLFEAGCVREINRPGISIKNKLMFLASILGFSLVGYHIAYGASLDGWIGAFDQDGPRMNGGLPWQFCQTGYAVIAATILSGAIAGRSRLRANVVAAFVVTALIYPVFAHWAWGGGWLLHGYGFHDFAGSGVVHLVGGLVAAVGCWVVGPRWHRAYQPVGDEPLSLAITEPLGPRDLSLASYGVILLMIGWMGFNGGSIHDLKGMDLESQIDLLGRLFLATAFAGVGGMLSVFVLDLCRQRLFQERLAGKQSMLIDPFATLAGVMGGMVAVTAACNELPNVYLALVIGATGGLVTNLVSLFVLKVLRLDDPVDAVGVHAGGGIVGVLFGVIAEGASIKGQLLGLAAALIFVLSASLVLFYWLDRFNWLRSPLHEEMEGLTFAPHKEVLVGDIRKQTTAADPPRRKVTPGMMVWLATAVLACGVLWVLIPRSASSWASVFSIVAGALAAVQTVLEVRKHLRHERERESHPRKLRMWGNTRVYVEHVLQKLVKSVRVAETVVEIETTDDVVNNGVRTQHLSVHCLDPFSYHAENGHSFAFEIISFDDSHLLLAYQHSTVEVVSGQDSILVDSGDVKLIYGNPPEKRAKKKKKKERRRAKEKK